jgi:hypothetical protein
MLENRNALEPWDSSWHWLAQQGWTRASH